MDFTFPVPEFKSNSETNSIQISKHENIDAISSSIDRYLETYSPKTLIAYKSDINDYIAYSNKTMQESDEQDILRYIKNMEILGLKNSTINRRIAALSKVFTIYTNLKLTNNNPIYNLSKISKIYRPISSQVSFNLTRHDVEAVISGAGRKTSAIVNFLVNTGLRVSEMLNISKDNLEAFNKEFLRIKILGKGNKIRFIFISYELYQEVKDVYDSESIFLFSSRSGKQLSRINVYKMVKKSFAKYSLKEHISPHTLRHLYATLQIREMKKDYKAVSKYLGHSSISTTLDLYVQSEISPEESHIL